MSAEQDQIKAGVSSALDDYAQYDSNGQPVTAEGGKKVLNVELATGSAVIGTVAIDQTTPGTTNGVQVNAALPAGTNNIGDVDVLSVIPGTGATNLGKAEDAAHATGDVGVMALAVANEANTTFAADGDYVPIATDRQGVLYANLKAGTNNIGDVDIASFPTGEETPTASTVTDSTASPVAAGKLAVTFTTSSDFAGTILGATRAASTTYAFQAITPGKTLAAIAYTVTAGSMIIDVQS